MDDHHIDGNAIAGLLGEIAAAEMTAVLRICQSCGHRHAIGEHRVDRGAGVVMRCPSCHDIAVVVGMQEDRLVVEWRGRYEIRR